MIRNIANRVVSDGIGAFDAEVHRPWRRVRSPSRSTSGSPYEPIRRHGPGGVSPPSSATADTNSGLQPVTGFAWSPSPHHPRAGDC